MLRVWLYSINSRIFEVSDLSPLSLLLKRMTGRLAEYGTDMLDIALLSESKDGEMGAEGGAASAGQSAKGKKGKKKNQKKIDPSLLGFSVESSRILQGELENIS